MGKDIEKEVVEVLKNSDRIGFEELQKEEVSPLNQAVIEKEIAGESQKDKWNIWKNGKSGDNTDHDNESGSIHSEEELSSERNKERPLDAPEQDFSEHSDDEHNDTNERIIEEKEEFELPTEAAKQAADTVFGTVNNLIDLGGGYFVKIRKHKDFYDFEEIIELIDTQNEKNVNRIKLDKTDKALLKPLLVQILKKKATKLTPERQLVAVVLSIILKKGSVVMEIKAENDLLVERVLDIVREEKGYSDQDLTSEDSGKDILDTAFEEINGKQEVTREKPLEEIEVNDPIIEQYDESNLEQTIVEVAE